MYLLTILDHLNNKGRSDIKIPPDTDKLIL